MCFQLYTKVYNYGREQAKQKGWRRPWDGSDGENFIFYQLSKGRPTRLAGEGGRLPGGEEGGGKDYDSDSDDNGGDYESAETFEHSVNRLLKQKSFDWTETQDMAVFDNEPYKKYSGKMGTKLAKYSQSLRGSMTDIKNMGMSRIGLG